MLIDEADVFMFKQTLVFYGDYLTKDIAVIGFTATPYNKKKKYGMDQKILDCLDFDVLYENEELKNVKQEPHAFTTLPNECNEELAVLIKDSLIKRPAVVYCSESFKLLLKTAGVDVIDLQQTPLDDILFS